MTAVQHSQRASLVNFHHHEQSTMKLECSFPRKKNKKHERTRKLGASVLKSASRAEENFDSCSAVSNSRKKKMMFDSSHARYEDFEFHEFDEESMKCVYVTNETHILKKLKQAFANKFCSINKNEGKTIEECNEDGTSFSNADDGDSNVTTHNESSNTKLES